MTQEATSDGPGEEDGEWAVGWTARNRDSKCSRCGIGFDVPAGFGCASVGCTVRDFSGKEATSVSELPADLQRALDLHTQTCVAILTCTMADVERTSAALVAAVLKYGDEQRSEGYKLGAKVIEVAGHD